MHVLLVDINPFVEASTPISLGNVGAALQAQGHQVRIFTIGSTTSFSPQDLAGYLTSFAPRLVGLGAYQRNMLHVRAFARLVKQVLPEASVVIGGPQATFMPDDGVALLAEIDFVSRAEGEQTIQALAEALEGGWRDQPIPGVTARTRDGALITGEPPPLPPDLDGYPSPWLTGLLDPAELKESILLTSRGCPNACCFCYTPAASGRRTRVQSVARVLEDISVVCRRGNGALWFADPNFTVDEQRVVQLLEGILARELDVSMWVETRADMLSPELIELMKRAGVHTVAFGLESASPNVFPALNKGLDPDRIARAAGAAAAADLQVELFSQFALPHERLADAMQTLRFVKDCGVPIRGNSNAQQMQLYFGSQVCADPQRFGVRSLRNRLPAYLSIGAAFETRWMTADEIEQVKSAWRAASLDGGKRVVSCAAARLPSPLPRRCGPPICSFARAPARASRPSWRVGWRPPCPRSTGAASCSSSARASRTMGPRCCS
jgi:radical SAM superfamily enzyme YgiQ (UPF0313 family)